MKHILKFLYLPIAVFVVSCGAPTPEVKPEEPELLVTSEKIDANKILADFKEDCERFQNVVCLERLPYLLPIEIIPQSEVSTHCKSPIPMGCAISKMTEDKKLSIRVVIANDLAEEGREFAFRWVIYHELGHALLKRDHSKEPSEFQTSIMYPKGSTGFTQKELPNAPNFKRCDKLTSYYLVKTRQEPSIMCQFEFLTDDECLKDAITQLFDEKLWDKPVAACNLKYRKSIY